MSLIPKIKSNKENKIIPKTIGALQDDKKDYNKSNGKIPFLDKLNKPLFINK